MPQVRACENCGGGIPIRSMMTAAAWASDEDDYDQPPAFPRCPICRQPHRFRASFLLSFMILFGTLGAMYVLFLIGLVLPKEIWAPLESLEPTPKAWALFGMFLPAFGLSFGSALWAVARFWPIQRAKRREAGGS